MARRSTTRRVLKWAGTVASAILLAAMALTFWYQVVWTDPITDFAVFDGTAHYWSCYNPQTAPVTLENPPPYGWRLQAQADWLSQTRLLDTSPLPRIEKSTIIAGGPQSTYVDIPLWLPLLLIALPTGFLWWRDRRRIPPGHRQKCGYDLTGNVSGRCPECGSAIVPRGEGRP